MCALLLLLSAHIWAQGGLSIGRRRRRPHKKYEPRVRANYLIRVPEVRVIDDKGNQLGVLNTREAISKAMEAELDLVEVAPKENPPVCRIMDFGKYLYEEKKKKRESKKKQTKVEVKECKFRPKIGDHDFYVRIRRAVKFLGQGNKVKLTVMFRGREHAHPEIAEKLIMRAFDDIKDLGKMEFHPKKEGRDMHTLIAPLPEVIRKKALKIRAAKAKAEAELKEIKGEIVEAKADDIEEPDEIEEEEIEDEEYEDKNVEPDDEKAAVPAEEH